MNKVQFFILLLLSATVTSKKCRFLKHFAFCQERGLKEIPSEVPKNSIKLFLHGNHLNSSSSLNSCLEKFFRLQILNLKSNMLTKVPMNLPSKTFNLRS